LEGQTLPSSHPSRRGPPHLPCLPVPADLYAFTACGQTAGPHTPCCAGHWRPRLPPPLYGTPGPAVFTWDGLVPPGADIYIVGTPPPTVNVFAFSSEGCWLPVSGPLPSAGGTCAFAAPPAYPCHWVSPYTILCGWCYLLSMTFPPLAILVALPTHPIPFPT